MAKDLQEAMKRDEALGLGSDEIAFYDALAERPEVLKQMGDETLKDLASELTEKLRASTSVDWQVRDSVRAKMRLLIKRLPRKYKYPPEGQEEAVKRVVEQAEVIALPRTSARSSTPSSRRPNPISKSPVWSQDQPLNLVIFSPTNSLTLYPSKLKNSSTSH